MAASRGPMPRPASTRPSTSGMPCCWLIARAAPSSQARSRQLRPRKLRSTSIRFPCRLPGASRPATATAQAGISGWRPAPAKCNLDACILAPAKSEVAMANDLLAREAIADFGEFRAYLRLERQEMVFEAFREADGRAWLLRVPLAARAAITGLLRELAALLADERSGSGRSRHPAPSGVGPQGRARRRAARGRPGARLRPVAARAAARRLGVDHRRGGGAARACAAASAA